MTRDLTKDLTRPTKGSTTPPVTTARWLMRFTKDMDAQGFSEPVIASLLPTVLAHLLNSEDLLTEADD